MDIANTPFFALMRERLGNLGERQRLISENIANASTPGYRPRDLDTSAFDRMVASQMSSSGQMSMTRTDPSHMAPGGNIDSQVITRTDSETTLDGNAVVLEDEMMRAAQVRMEFETGIALYQHGLQMIRTAARPPGR